MNPLYAILIITLASCSTSKDSLQVQPVNESWPNKEWQAYAYEKVGVLPMTPDGVEWCPQGLTRANRVHLLAALVKHESNFNPNLEYKEAFKNGRGEWVISTGLGQVSYESARGYGFRDATTQKLKDPEYNIKVVAAILKRWFAIDGVVSGRKDGKWRGGARYFSVFRYKSDSMKAYLARFCQ